MTRGHLMVLKQGSWALERRLCFRALAVLIEDLGSVLSNHPVAHNHL